MTLREYQPQDCGEVAELFRSTVLAVNAGDYAKEQLNAWIAGADDLRQWDRSLREHYCIVAIEDGRIAGFGDMDAKAGFLDRLYVHKDYQRRGIATAICDRLERTVQGKIVSCVSITAKPFFENRGFRVVKAQYVERKGILLQNFVMEKTQGAER